MSDLREGDRSSLTDEELNLKFNRERWGNLSDWHGKDNYGTRWGGGYQQKNGEVAYICDNFLKPHLSNRYDLNILELSPGGGRFTAELIRYSEKYHFLDMNQACLDICKERFKYYPIEMRFYCNDGKDCSVLGEAREFDLIACFDSMVHMHRDIARGYLYQFSKLISKGGTIFLDHPGKGARSAGHRTDIYKDDIVDWAREFGLHLVSQEFRNKSGDCISVLRG
jgi:SAM-dependent methyltransferase